MKISFRNNTNLLAIVLMLANCFCTSVMAALQKIVGHDLNIGISISLYNFICLMPMIGIVAIKGLRILKTEYLRYHVIRALLCSIALFLFYKALQMTSITSALAIGLVDPLLTCVFAWILLGEPLRRSNIIALILSMIGALLIINPGYGAFNSGGILVLISTVLWAMSNIIMKKMSKTEDDMGQIFYMCFFKSIFAMGFYYFDSSGSTNVSLVQFGLLVAVALVGLVHYYLLYKSLSLAPADIIMPFYFTGLIFSQIIDIAVFNMAPNRFELAGYSFIILGCVYLLKRQIKESRNSTI